MIRNCARLIAASCAVALLAAGPALACPKALGEGVLVRFDDGSSSLLTPTQTPNLIREDVTMPAPDENYAQEAWFGIFLHRIWFDGVDAPPSEVTDYAEPPQLPAPNSMQQGLAAVVTEGTHRIEQRIDVSAGPLAEIGIGACAYSSYEVELRVFESDYMYRERFIMLPELGAAILIETQDSEDTLSFRPVAILSAAEAAARGND